MTWVSNDPSLWPLIDSHRISSYVTVAASAGVMYDWALTFGQEIELVWRQRWSLMTVLYLILRYFGMLYVIINILVSVPTISGTDVSCQIMWFALVWMSIVGSTVLGVIVIARLHAMYQRSRKVLLLLGLVFLVVNIANGVLAAISMMGISAEEQILFGTYQCTVKYEGDSILLASVTWILGTVWEFLAMFLAAWIVVKHFRELQRSSVGGVFGNSFTMLLKSHATYFMSFIVVSGFRLGYLSPTISADLYSLESLVYFGLLDIFQFVQMFVLGPRLILSVREYYAKLVAESIPDAATGMNSIVFQERVHVVTSDSV